MVSSVDKYLRKGVDTRSECYDTAVLEKTAFKNKSLLKPKKQGKSFTASNLWGLYTGTSTAAHPLYECS